MRGRSGIARLSAFSVLSRTGGARSAKLGAMNMRKVPICRRVGILLAGLFVMITMANAQSSRSNFPDLSGEWVFDILTSPNGPGTRDVLIRQEGERVIGFAESEMASGGFVGTFDGTNLKFTVVLKFGNLPVAGDYVAVVEGDTMAGTIDYGDYGTATFEGRRGRREEIDTSGDIVGLVEGTEIGTHVDGRFGVELAGVLTPELVDMSDGTFLMGSQAEGSWDDTQVLHQVALSAFRIGRFPVTNAQYAAFCEATNCEPPLDPRGWVGYFKRYPNHPVINVNWEDANAYTRWLSDIADQEFRLPTEAEWEYAALGGDEGRLYSWGDDWQTESGNTLSWHAGEMLGEDWRVWWQAGGEKKSESQVMTTRVGSFPPNDWDLFDITGNVWEWTNDWYGKDYYEVSPTQDPTGPETGNERVLRGGSWYNKPLTSRIAVRDRYAPDLRLSYNGFRVVAERR